jgi:hypothetical protein
VESELSLGEKWTLKASVLPASSVMGSLGNPSTRNAVFETESCAIWTESDPLFEIANFSLEELPMLTDPKSMAEGVATRLDPAGLTPPRATTPPHPVRDTEKTQPESRASRAKLRGLRF